jgi:tetratricopeptide (TPR) repeat protein
MAAAATPAAFAQPLFDTPRVSPTASVTQRVGITDITIDYHRPGVKNRDIWGTLVPYDQVWRAGANENTTITFSDAVFISDTRIEAGTYGLHVLPTENDWTFILSHQASAWGSFSYEEAEDAVRVTVSPVDIPHEEYLTYSFDNPTRNEVDVTLSWEMLEGSFSIWVDTDEIMVNDLREGLRGLARFSWRGWQQAAAWCLQNDTNLEEAMEWINRSIEMEPNFSNLRVKAGLLEKTGNTAEADQMIASAMGVATEGELNVYGYQLIGQGEIDKAIDVFAMNAEKHPNSWNCYDSLAEAYMNKGDTQKAIEFYEKALSMVDDELQKGRIRAQLSRLRS